MENAPRPVWFITGCSSGFGRSLAEHVLSLGYTLAATARKPEQLRELAAEGEVLTLPLDVTDSTQVNAAVRAAEARFGRIDVLVNNAGINYFAAVEESEEDQIQRLFATNFFGASRMMRAVLPGMRRRRTGQIVNLTSAGGLSARPAFGYYSASKFALEGLSEALALEVAPLGIRVLMVEPGAFRTDIAQSAQESKITIADYAETAGAAREKAKQMAGKQPGDPALAARAMVRAVESDHPPRRLLLGRDAYAQVNGKLAGMRDDFEAWKATTLGTDFRESASPPAASP